MSNTKTNGSSGADRKHPWLYDLGRSAAAYIIFVLVSGLLSMLFMIGGNALAEELNLERRIFYIAAAALLPLSFYSIMRAFELHDGEAQAAFPLASTPRYRFLSGMGIQFSSPTLRRKLFIRILFTVLAVILLPYNLGYRFLVAAVDPSATGARAELISALIACPMFSLLILLAHTSAHKWWVIAPTGERDRLLRVGSHIPRLVLELVKITVVYAFAFPVLPAIFMLILSVALTFGKFTLWMWVALAAVILLCNIVRACAAVSARSRFLRRMRRTLSREGFSLSKIQRPILSVFLPDRDEDFTVCRDGKTYHCKLLGSVHRRRPTFISPDGVITEKHTVTFLKFTLFHVMHDTRYEMEGENQIIIFSPMPKKLYINYGRTDTAPDDGDGGTLPSYVTVMAAAKGGVRHGRATDRSIHGPGYVSDVDRGVIKPFETGERVGGVKFFTPEGFISAVENDCLDR